MAEKFSSRVTFIAACAGSAVGLGNLFRFPLLCLRYGACFLPVYLLLLVVLGFPLLYFELLLGRRWGGAAPKAFGALGKAGKPVGGLCCGVSFIVLCCYGLLFSFVLASSVFSLALFFPDGADSARIFASNVAPDRFTLPALFFLAVGWIFILLCFGSAKKLGAVSLVCLCLSAALLLCLAVFAAVSHPEALLFLLRPDLSPLLTLKFWADTAGQVFFSLSLATGVMVTYGSFLDSRENLLSSTLWIVVFDLAFSLAGTVIYLAFAERGAEPTIFSCFAVYPTAFATLGRLGGLLSLLFFISLAFLCLDSAVAYLKAVTSCLSHKISAKEPLRALIFALPAFVFGLFILSLGLLPYFDGRVIPLFSLLAGSLEALTFSYGARGGKHSPLPLKGGFFTLSARFTLPLFTLFLFFCEIFY